MKRRLIIDAQVFQTPAKDRGMGKYSLELLASMAPLVLKQGWSSVELLFSKQLNEQSYMESNITNRLKDVQFINLPLLPNQPGNHQVSVENRKVIDKYILSKNQGQTHIDFLILSLMQGEICPVFPSDAVANVNKYLLFYDIVPLMFHKMYLDNPITKVEYLSKIEELLKADTYLTISKTVANDLVTYLGVDSGRIKNIDGGPADHSEFTQAIDMPKPFILMPTGNDLRKNNERAVKGFEEFNKKCGGKYKLAITSFFKDFQIEELTKLSKNLIFTGNIKGAELNYLYRESSALLFPSEYEGLGMPILEALRYNKPIACSNISVFREISPSAFAYFDPYSVAEIAATLDIVTKNHEVDEKEYKSILTKYSWPRTAETVISIMQEHASMHKQINKKTRATIFCPDPTWDSSAGRFAQESYAELSRFMDCDFYISECSSPNERRINYLQYTCSTKSIIKGLGFTPNAHKEIIYYIDNSSSSAEVIFSALANPGTCVMLELPDENVWRCMVKKGLISESRLQLEKELNQKINSDSTFLLTSLISRQHAIVVFDSTYRKILNRIATEIKSSIRLYNFKFPILTLVYDDALPDKTVSVKEAHNELFTDPYITDFYWKEELAKTKVLMIGDKDSPTLAYGAMSLGTIPAISTDMARKMSLPQGTYLPISNDESSTEEVFLLVDDSKTFEKMSINARKFIHKQKTYKSYSQSIAKILNDEKAPPNRAHKADRGE